MTIVRATNNEEEEWPVEPALHIFRHKRPVEPALRHYVTVGGRASPPPCRTTETIMADLHEMPIVRAENNFEQEENNKV